VTNKHEGPHYIQAVQTFHDLGYSTFRKLERLSSFAKVGTEFVCLCVCGVFGVCVCVCVCVAFAYTCVP